MKLRRIFIPVIIVTVGFLTMYILINLKSDPPPRHAAARVLSLESKVVVLGDVATEIPAFGRVVSTQPVQLISEVSGELKPGTVDFLPALSFKKGDLLLKVDDRRSRLKLNSAKSDLLSALASVLPEIKSEFPAEYPVWEEYFNSCGFDDKLKDLPEAANQKIKLYLSRFNVYKLYFNIRDLEIDLEKHYFYAPFDGSIQSVNSRAGTTVRNGSVLGEILNLEALEIEVPIPAVDVRWVSYDTPVTLNSSELNGSWTGQIARIGRAIDDRTQTVPVYVSLDNNQQFPVIDGLFLKANIPGSKIENGFEIPLKALYNEEFVYLIKNGKLEYRKVDVARKETSTVIIENGLVAGDTLVVEMLKGVAEGMAAEARITATEIGNN